MPMPTARDNASIHSEQVESWRADAWRKLGFNADWADFLAGTAMDLHRAERMLSQGATTEQVVQILAGYGPLGEDPSFDWVTFAALVAALAEAETAEA